MLLLPGGGEPHSRRRPSALAAAQALPLARQLVAGPGDEVLVAHTVQYRYRGWNGTAADPAQDAEWAVQEAVRRYGDVPVCLAGVDVGARAALRAAGHPAVSGVLAFGPMLPRPADQQQQKEDEQDPVQQLAGRQVLLVHGTDDVRTDPELSYRLAERAKKVTADVCRFEVHTDGHGLRHRRTEVVALGRDFVGGVLCGRDFARPLVDAMAAPPPLGLRMPLAAGFGRALRL